MFYKYDPKAVAHNTNEDELNYRIKALMNFHIKVFLQILKHIRQTQF